MPCHAMPCHVVVAGLTRAFPRLGLVGLFICPHPSRGLYSCTEFLCDTDVEGTVIDWRDHQGQTALHYAVKEAQVQVVELLLGCGADPLIKDKHDTTPEHLAGELGHMACKQCIASNVAMRLNDFKNAGGDQTRVCVALPCLALRCLALRVVHHCHWPPHAPPPRVKF